MKEVIEDVRVDESTERLVEDYGGYRVLSEEAQVLLRSGRHGHLRGLLAVPGRFSEDSLVLIDGHLLRGSPYNVVPAVLSPLAPRAQI